MNYNLHNCFSLQGGFVARKAYVEFFKELPSIYEIELDSKEPIDCSKLNVSNLTDIFECDNSAIILHNQYLSANKTSAVDEDDDDDDTVWRNGDMQSKGFVVIDTFRKKVWEITKTRLTLFHCDKNPEDIFKDILDKLPKKKEVAKSAEIGLIAYDNGYYTVKSKVNKIDINIEENYNDDFIPVHEDVINFIEQKGSGLIILNGVKGSGKTSYIKYLTSQYPKKYRIVTNAIAQRLAEPEFVSFLLEEKDSIFILEDCEQILMDRAENTFGGAISNILNMSDGLMSDIFNIKFICTFNADINKIDSALLRKGRCFANYEFKELSVDKVKHLSEKNNLSINVTKPMTLAEIYNYESTDYDSSTKPQKKIGF